MRFRNSEAISLVLCALLLRCIVGMAQRPCRSTVFVTVIVGLFSWALSVKWDAILAALQALGKVH